MDFGRTSVNRFHNFYDSRLFWGILGVISLTVHGAIALVLIIKIVRVELQPTGGSIPVELIAIAPEAQTSSPVPPQSDPEATEAIAPPPVPERPNPLLANINEGGTDPVPVAPRATPSPPASRPATVSPPPRNPSPPRPKPSTTPPPRPTPPSPPATTSPGGATTGTTGSPAALAVDISAWELARTDIDIPDQLAQPLQQNQQLEAIAYLEAPKITLQDPIVITVELTIDHQGNLDEILSAKPTPATLSDTEAKQLATKILSRWQFTPSYMGGQPVFQAYRLNLNIQPIFSP